MPRVRVLVASLMLSLTACGRETVEVPSFEPSTPVADVQNRLEESGLVVDLSEAPCGASSGCPAGFVATRPKAGTEVEAGSTVELIYYR